MKPIMTLSFVKKKLSKMCSSFIPKEKKKNLAKETQEAETGGDRDCNN